MSRKTFSRKTVAIALASATAFGGINIVAPQGSEFAAPTAQAQETNPTAKPGVQTSDVKYLGVFDDKGKVSSPFESAQYNKKYDSQGRVIGVKDGYQIRGEFSLENANPGDTLHMTPVTKFNLPNGDEAVSSHGGLRITQTIEWTDVEHDGVVIGRYRYTKSGSITLEFSDAVADVKSGTVTLSAPTMVWDFYVNPDKNGVPMDEWDGKGFSNPVENTTNIDATAKPKSGESERATVGTAGTVRFLTVTSNTTKDRLTAYENKALIVDTEDYTVRRTDTTVRIPAGANGTVTLDPNIDHPKGADWYFEDNLTFSPYVRVYGQTGTDAEYESEHMPYEDAQKQFPGLKIEAEKTGRGVTITTEGIPENVKPYIRILPGKGARAISYGTYVENAAMYYKGKFTGTINGEAKERNVSNNIGTMVAIPGQPSVAGVEGINRTGDLTGSIVGQPDGLGVDGSVAPIGGTKQTFQFFVKNTGDAPLVAPIVTLPNGKKKAIKNVAIAPNETGSFEVEYDVPEGNGALNFNVSLSRATLSPSDTISFRYGQADQAASAANSIKYKEVKAPRGTTTTVKPTGVPKGAQPARTEGTPDWAQIGPDGTLTLRPDNSAPLGRTEIPVKFTFSDGSETTVNPVVNVSEFDGSIDGDKDFDPRTQDEKTDEAIIGGLEDLNNKTQEQNEELKRQTDELKKQADALNKQAETLGKIQNELDESNTLAKKQNELIGKQTDAINKQTDAIDKQTAAVEKQTAEVSKRLDKANKIAEDQLKTMNKELEESIKQTKEMIRQSKALEHQNKILIDQHKDQLAQWEKENKFAQNEQDDRRHKANFERCVTSDPATGVLVALPILSLAAAVGVPYVGHMLEDANSQLAGVNARLGQQAGIPEDLRKQIAAFNSEHGDMVRTAATAIAGISALAGLAVAINNLTNGCYAEADISVGREPQAPKTSSESVLSSKPWIQEDKQDAEAENADAEVEAETEGTEAANQ